MSEVDSTVAAPPKATARYGAPSLEINSLQDGLDRARALNNTSEILAASVAINLLSLALPILLLQIYDRIIPNQAVNTLVLFVIGFVCAQIADTALTIGRAYVTGWNGARLQHAVGCAAMNRFLNSDLQSFEAQAPGVQLQRLRSVDTIRGFYSGQTALLWIDLPFGIVFLGLIMAVGGKLVLLPITVMLLATLLAIWLGRRLRASLEDRAGSDNRRYNFIIDVLGKVATVKAIGMESLMVRRYERLQSYSAAASYRSTFFSSLARGTGAMTSQIMMAGVAAYGSTMVIDGSLSVGSLAACTLLAGRAARPLMRMLGIWTQYQNVQIARRQVDEIFEIPLDNAAGKTAEDKAQNAPLPIALNSLAGQIEFSDTHFSYAGKTQSVLNGIDCEIEPGQAVAITGRNGSGKSTLLQLIATLLKPTSGVVRIDGVATNTIDPEELRPQICFLPQTGSLFEGTILENLTMFKVDEHLDRAFEISNQLGLNDVIARLPDGYDTMVGNGPEAGLPGGVRQRIVIARSLVLAGDPRIILFDEANSLLDPRSDDLLIALLQQYRGRATMILVSHRPKILELADRGLALRDGRLSPEELPAAADKTQPNQGSST